MEGNTELQKTSEGQITPEAQVVETPEGDWLKNLKGRFNKVFKRERKIGHHRTIINIFYSPHRSAEDMNGLADQFQKCDIYFPETFGWSPEYLNALRKLSDGQITPKMALQDWGDEDPYHYSRDEDFFKIIYKSKKPIAFLDIPQGHLLVDREKENKVPKINFGSNFGQVLDSVREYIKKAADIHKERETYIVKQLQPQIRELLKANPKLRKKQEVNVLISIGIAHTSLYRNLKEEHETTAKFGKKPMAFRYTEEALSKNMSNYFLGDDIVARIATEWTLSKAHKKLFRTSDSLNDAISMRRLISRFSFDEIRNMFESAKDFNEWEDMFIRGMKERVRAAAANLSLAK